MSIVQAGGITLTFLGLYLYDRSSDSSNADRRASRMQMRPDDNLLPLVTEKKTDDRPPTYAGSGIGTAGAVPGTVLASRFNDGLQTDTKRLNGWLASTKQDGT